MQFPYSRFLSYHESHYQRFILNLVVCCGSFNAWKISRPFGVMSTPFIQELRSLEAPSTNNFHWESVNVSSSSPPALTLNTMTKPQSLCTYRPSWMASDVILARFGITCFKALIYFGLASTPLKFTINPMNLPYATPKEHFISYFRGTLNIFERSSTWFIDSRDFTSISSTYTFIVCPIWSLNKKFINLW